MDGCPQWGRAVPVAVVAMFVVLTAVLTGCGKTQFSEKPTAPCACGGSVSSTPGWYLDRTGRVNYKDSAFVDAVAAADSQEMEAAVDMALENGRDALAKNLDTKITQDTRSFVDTLSDAEARHFAEAKEETVRALTRNASPVRKEVAQQEGGTVRAFVLMHGAMEEAARTLLSKLEDHEQLHTAFRDSWAYKELKGAPDPENRPRSTRSQQR